MTSRALGIAVVGAGMAGQAHAYGYRNVKMDWELADVDVELAAIVDPNESLARSVAARYGFARAHAELDAVLADQTIHAMSLALPNHLYATTIPRAVAAGKHVLAEKPLGRSAREALALALAADAARCVHAVGFSWRRVAAVEAVAQLVRTGELGEIWHAFAWYLTDYASTPRTPLSWRYQRELAGGGALVDVGTHVFAVVEHVAGPIRRVLAAHERILIPERAVPAGPLVGHAQADASGELGAVTTDDVTTLLGELEGGGSVQVTASRVATGVANSLGFQIFGSSGSVAFDSTRPDEFQLYTRASAPRDCNGRRVVVLGPEQPSFARAIPMPVRGVGSGYGAAFVAQAQDFVSSILTGRAVASDFWSGYRAMLLCDAAQRAAAEQRAVDLVELDAEIRAAG